VIGDKVIVTTADSPKQKRPTSGFGGGGGGFGMGGGGGGFPKGGLGGGKAPDDAYKFQVVCLNAADGNVIWKETATEQKPTTPKFPSNSYASETPVSDGERIYAYFGMTGVFCYDLAGKQLWKADIGSYPMAMGFGTGSSPALVDGKLIIQCDNDRESFLIALNTKDGKEAWRTKRSERTGYSSPFIWKTKNRTEIICVGAKLRSYNPADGKQLWELGGLTPQPKATPVATEEILYVGTGGGGGGFGMGGGGPKGGGPKGGIGGPGGGAKPLFAVKAGASGDISLKSGEKSNDYVLWHLPQAGPSTSSPLLHKDLLYILEERGGILACYDAKAGKQHYKERINGARGFTSSPWLADGKVYCLDDSGTTHVVQSGKDFKLVGSNSLGGMCWATPAAAGGSLFLRTAEHVYCIRSK
jgi:outer membrane protein assembly factor BamB